MFTRAPKFDLQVTHNFGAGDVTWRSVLNWNTTYPALFDSGTVTDLAWDNGSVDLNSVIASSPRWLFSGGVWEATEQVWGLAPNFFDGYGVVSWSIDAGPGHVPGTLHVACYLPFDDPDTPDSLTSYALGPGAWSTGSLPVSNGEFFPDQWFQVYVRFVPEHLQALL